MQVFIQGASSPTGSKWSLTQSDSFPYYSDSNESKFVFLTRKNHVCSVKIIHFKNFSIPESDQIIIGLRSNSIQNPFNELMI